MPFGRAPEYVVHRAAQLDVIVGELAKLGIVEPQFLLLDRGAQAQARDQIHDKQDDTGDNEGPREPSDAVGELVGQLDVVVVEPAAIDLGEAIKVSDVVADEQLATCSKLNVVVDRQTYAAKRPVRRFPTIPPTPCSAKTSSASSIPTQNLILVAKLHAMPPTTP